MLVCRFSGVIDFIRGFVGSFMFHYCFLVLSVLFFFLFLRVPYVYGVFGFVLFLLGWVLPLYLSFLFTRIRCEGVSKFLSGFVPAGSPLWIAPFVSLAETVSYIVRPVVLLIRPFLNITIGAMGGLVLGSLSLSNLWVCCFLILLFFYEIFVVFVHWFIVCNILSFSSDH